MPDNLPNNLPDNLPNDRARQDALATLTTQLAAMNRGILATEADQQAILHGVAQLEACNPAPEPFSRPDLLAGDWRLLYTTSQELLGINRWPLIQLGNVYQCVRMTEARIYNFAEIMGLAGVAGLVSVTARFEVVSQQRVDVSFDRAIFGVQPFLGYQSPSQFIPALEQTEKFNLWQGIDFGISRERTPGWLEITYLDEHIRVGRGNQGSVFVLQKVSN